MNHVIERGPYGAQLSFQVPEGGLTLPYQLEILMAERPEGLLPVFRQSSPQGVRFVCPVTGLISLTELTKEKRLTRRQAETILRQVVKLKAELPDHLLTNEQLILHPELLFVRPHELQIQVVYQPFLPVSEVFSDRHLADWMGEAICGSRLRRRCWKKHCQAILAEQTSGATAMHSVPHSTVSLSVRLLAGIQVSAFLLTVLLIIWPDFPIASLADMKLPLLLLLLVTIPVQLLLISKDSSWSIHLNGLRDKSGDIQMKQSDSNRWQLVYQRLATKIKTVFQSGERPKAADPVLLREQPTELLSSKQATFRLATLSEGMIGTAAELAGQRAFILTEDFLIGRDSRLVDLCLTGHAVGRSHARITRKGATFFLMDLGSKNGTRLNGECLNKLVDYRLPDRCQIQFADRLFYFEAEELAGQDPIVRGA